MQIDCARCGASFLINETAAPDQLLVTSVCPQCLGLPEVRAFLDTEQNWHCQEQERANAARQRFQQRKLRLEREEQQRLEKLSGRSQETASDETTLPDHIQAALQRARSRQRGKT